MTSSVSAASRPRRSRWITAGLVVLALLVLFALFLGGVALFQWTESTAFCSSCHVMHPEFTAYQVSPHSKVDCGTCHIGPGVGPALQAKLASVRYLWEVPFHLYPQPIPSPITSLRPVEVVCEQCHRPQQAYADRSFVRDRYAADETNSKTQVALQMHTGNPSSQLAGPSRGIHWHIDNPVYYIATDEQRQNIPWVQAEFNGVTTTYTSTDSTLTPQQIASAEKRKMDCIDCHNRATHVFQQPNDALDAALSNSAIPADLPFIKQQGLLLLDQNYATEEDAAKAIAGLPDWYKTNHPDVYATREADIKAATAAIQGIFDKTQFPFMKVNSDTHPNNIGHKDFPGCFRCHDGKHLSQDKQAIRLECNICHAIPQVAAPGQTLQPIPISLPAEPDSHKSTTWLAEHRYKFDASCASCHTISDPGGTSNTSFCSNSACHGTNWQYAGLNAPEVRTLGAPAQTVSTGQPMPVPHPIGANTDCKICHGPGKVRPFPENHASYTVAMCTGCHQPSAQAQAAAGPAATAAPGATSAPAATAAPAAGSGIPAIPHEIAGREQCLTCHNPNGGIKPAPQDHAGRTNDTCQGCHKPAAGATPAAAGTTTAAAAATPGAAATAASTAAATAGPASAATPGATSAPAATAVPAAGSGIPAIPHEIAGREQCLTCHNPNGGIKPAPQDHAGRTNDTCQTCHKPAAGATPAAAGTTTAAGAAPATPAGAGATPAAVVAAGEPPKMPHPLAGHEQCLTCHNPEGGTIPAPKDHVGRTEENCTLCHQSA